MTYYNVTGANLKVAHCDDTLCTTATVRTLDGFPGVGEFSSLTVGSDGLPIISYYDSNTCGPLPPPFCSGRRLRVAHCNDVACSSATVTVVATNGVGADATSMIIGADGLALVTFKGSNTFNVSTSSLKVIHCENIACTAFGAPSVFDSVVGVNTSGQDVTSVLGSDGLPLIVYRHFTGPEDGPVVARCNNASCSSVNLRYIGDEFQQNPSHDMALGANGFAFVSHIRGGNLRLTRCTDAACSGSTTRTIATGFFFSSNTGIALGRDDLGVIAYFDDDADDLRVSHCNNPTCTSVSSRLVDAAGSVGRYPSLAIGIDGAPVISYYDQTNGNLKVAHVCPITAGCGNGVIEVGETCDDGDSIQGDDCGAECLPTRTPTITATWTLTRTQTPTRTPTITQTPTHTPSETPTETHTETKTPTLTETPTVTSTPTQTGTFTPVHTVTPTPTTALCGPVPATGCHVATTSSISVRNSDEGARDSLSWRWRGSGDTASAELGTPLIDTNYVICLYDRFAGVPSLALAETAPGGATCAGGPCWTETSRGVRYKDKNPITRGMLQISAKVIPGKGAAFKVKAVGDRLHLPAPANATQLFRQHPNVLVQLVNGENACWEASYPAAANSNTVEKFRDRVP